MDATTGGSTSSAARSDGVPLEVDSGGAGWEGTGGGDETGGGTGRTSVTVAAGAVGAGRMVTVTLTTGGVGVGDAVIVVDVAVGAVTVVVRATAPIAPPANATAEPNPPATSAAAAATPAVRQRIAGHRRTFALYPRRRRAPTHASRDGNRYGPNDVTRVLKVDDLAPAPGRTARFEGREHDANVSFYVSRVPAGGGPGLHTHPYEETFVIHEGSATFTAGEERVEAEPGMIIVVPPNTPHKFTAGPDGLRSVNIHGSDRMIQEDLPGDSS